MYKEEGIIFNIQKFSIHDGSGIRTLIFMKGCPLRCLWCSNPESQTSEIEIMDVKSNCNGCGKCVRLCSRQAIDAKTLSINKNHCNTCGICAQNCYANAKKIVGKKVTIDELMCTVEKERIFYKNSGGGVTVGGGEPLLQSSFVTALLKECKKFHIHTAIETSGYGKWDKVKDVFENTDQIFYDLKCMDSKQHKRLTGVDNTVILENAQKAAALKKEIIFRLPLVPGLNDQEQNIYETGVFLSGLKKLNEKISIEILPYHNLGRDKYMWLGIEYKLDHVEKPGDNILASCRRSFAEMGLRVV